MPKTVSVLKGSKSSSLGCKKGDTKGFDNSGNNICFPPGTRWIGRLSVYPTDYEDAFAFLKRELNGKLGVSKLWIIHRWLGKNCRKFVGREVDGICAARFNFLKTNWKNPIFKPFIPKSEITLGFQKCSGDGIMVTISQVTSGDLEIYVWCGKERPYRYWEATILLNGKLQVSLPTTGEQLKFDNLKDIQQYFIDKQYLRAPGGSLSVYTTL